MDWKERKARLEQIHASKEYLKLMLKTIQEELLEPQETIEELRKLWILQRQIVDQLKEEHNALIELKKML